MDNKQKKRILSSVYKASILFALCAIAWVCYFSISNLANNSAVIWLDITVLVFAVLLFIEISINISKTKKLKNLYLLSKLLFFLVFALIVGVIAGVFTSYYTAVVLPVGYYLTVGVIIFAYMLAIAMFVISIKLIKLYNNTSVYIEDSVVPNYDDELMLKKKLDELNRKREMKKVVDQIKAIKNELGED